MDHSNASLLAMGSVKHGEAASKHGQTSPKPKLQGHARPVSGAFVDLADERIETDWITNPWNVDQVDSNNLLTPLIRRTGTDV